MNANCLSSHVNKQLGGLAMISSLAASDYLFTITQTLCWKYFSILYFFSFRDFPSALPGMYEQIVRETEKFLDDRGLNKLTSQQKDMLKGQTEGITFPDNTVFNLISE